MLNLSIFTLMLSLFLAPTSAQTKERKAELLHYAMENVNKQNYAVAEQTLDKLIAMDAANADAWFLRGYCKHMKGEHSRALPDLDKTLQIDPRYTNAYLIRARSNRALGHYWSALRDYNKARQQDPYLTFFSLSKGMAGESR